MGKIVMIAAVSATLIRMADEHFYYGKYTGAFMLMVHDILRHWVV